MTNIKIRLKFLGTSIEKNTRNRSLRNLKTKKKDMEVSDTGYSIFCHPFICKKGEGNVDVSLYGPDYCPDFPWPILKRFYVLET